MGSWLTICNHQNLTLTMAMTREQPAGNHQRMMHIGALSVATPSNGGNIFVAQFLSHLGKSNNVQIVARILHFDQTVQRHRHFFRRLEAIVHKHRAALIQHQDS